jgi:hypothetical protein
MSEDGLRLGHIRRKTLHRVSYNSDTSEGRGQTSYTFFASKDVALRAAKGNYVMGTDCPVVMTSPMVFIEDETGATYLLGEKVEIQFEDPRVVRERALAKLTLEERAVLGLK